MVMFCYYSVVLVKIKKYVKNKKEAKLVTCAPRTFSHWDVRGDCRAAYNCYEEQSGHDCGGV